MVRPEGVEPPTYWFVASCSIQLSYGRTLRGKQPSKNTGIPHAEQTSAESKQEAIRERIGAPGRIRTSDPLVRSQMLYPAELRARERRNSCYVRSVTQLGMSSRVYFAGTAAGVSPGSGAVNIGSLSTISSPARRNSWWIIGSLRRVASYSTRTVFFASSKVSWRTP
jgi:hypothetical protein